MADDMVVLQCEACSARMKVRAVTTRIMKDVKCPKCGRKVSTKSVVAGGEPAPASPPAETPEPPAPEAAPVPVEAPPASAPVAAPAPAPAQAPVPSPEAPPPPAAPVPPPAPPPAAAVEAPSVSIPVAAPAPAPVAADTEELKQARARNDELDRQVKELTARVAELVELSKKPVVSPAEAELVQARKALAAQEQQIKELTARVAELVELSKKPVVSPAEAELAQARKLLAEQEQRLVQLQQMWYAKEKEARALASEAQRAQREHKFTQDQIEAVLKAYHQAEIEAATERLNNLGTRLQAFLSQQTSSP